MAEQLSQVKKILIIGAGVFQIDGLKKAKTLGYYVIATDGDPNAAGKNIADEFHCIDVKDFEKNLGLARKRKIDAVASIASEVSLETVSYISDTLGLEGIPMDIVTVAHDKKKYYNLFKNHNVLIPNTYYFNELKGELCGNLIIKPSKGSGSRGVKFILGTKDFDFKQYAHGYLENDEEIIIQEVVEGKEMTVDGFVVDDRFHILAISEEFNDLSKNHTFSSELIFPPQWITRKIIRNVDLVCNAIKTAIGLKNGPMHLEFKLFNDELYLIDFSLRGGGFDVFTKIIGMTSGVDILAFYLTSLTGEKNTIKKVDSFKPVTLSFIYPEKQGSIVDVINADMKGKHHCFYLKFLCKVGDRTIKPESGKERLAYFICWGDNFNQVIQTRDEVRQKVRFIIN